jgi:hypothetical protein
MTPTTRTELITAIGKIAEQIDHLTGAPPGSAIRGIYFWFWPAADCDLDTLQALHRDALELLVAAQAEKPSQALCDAITQHPAMVSVAVADRQCACGREILDDAIACDRCQPILNGPERPTSDSGTA